jgi:hypothetical protein
VYSYFRPARVDAANFQLHRMESQVASVFAGMSSFGDDFGRQTVAKKLQEGFTVIAHDADQANVEFAVGIVPLGQKPFHPYQIEKGDGNVTYENERVEVHQNERDFVGPIVVEGNGKGHALVLKVGVDGAPAIGLLVLRQQDAEASLSGYYEYGSASPLVGTPLSSEVINAGNAAQRSIVVPPGTYYVVFDNTGAAGQVASNPNPLDDRAAVVNYLIQIGATS